MKVLLLIHVKKPTFVGISTFMSRQNSILGLSKISSYLSLKNAEFLDIFIYMY